MNDTNNDGIPNDGEWIEIKGSEYNNPETIHDYQVTYYKPVNNGNVTWKDDHGNKGELSYLYVTFIAVVLLIIGIDKGIKLVRKKLKEKEEIFNEHKPANPIE